MKIFLVPSTYLPSVGGVELNTHHLAKGLLSAGHQVVVITSNWRRWSLPFHEVIEGVNVYRLPFYVFRGSLLSLLCFIVTMPLTLLGFWTLYYLYRPEVTNIHFGGANSFCLLVAHFVKRFPLVLSLHGNEVITLRDKHETTAVGYTRVELRLMTWSSRALLRRCDYVTAVSRYLLKNAARFDANIVHKSQTILMGGFVDRERQCRSPKITIHKPFILAVGRLHREKGFDLLIEAFRLVAPLAKDISLVIVGDGPEMDNICRRVEAFDLSARVRLTGSLPREAIRCYYENCLFLVVPSRWEGLPAVILEAFSYGKSVVASRVGGIPELVIDNDTGILVEPENITLLMTAIYSLVSKDAVRHELEANVDAFWQQSGAARNMEQNYEGVYQAARRKYSAA